MQERNVVVCGDSLLMVCVEASLKQMAGWHVLRFNTTQPNADERLRALHPDVLLFDLAVGLPGYPLSLLQEQHALALIGLHASCDRVIVLSGQQRPASTIGELTQAIQSLASAIEAP
jgi:DNA-binding NarL/FixJ family response regulator